MQTIDLTAIDDIALRVKIDDQEYAIPYPSDEQFERWMAKQKEVGETKGSDKLRPLIFTRELVATVVCPPIPQETIKGMSPLRLYELYRATFKTMMEVQDPLGGRTPEEVLGRAAIKK